jgi:hypothetical protein
MNIEGHEYKIEIIYNPRNRRSLGRWEYRVTPPQLPVPPNRPENFVERWDARHRNEVIKGEWISFKSTAKREAARKAKEHYRQHIGPGPVVVDEYRMVLDDG